MFDNLPQAKISTASPSVATPTPTKPNSGNLFANLPEASAPATPTPKVPSAPKAQGLFASLPNRSSAPASPTSPYWAGEVNGATFGPSKDLDTSGHPFLDYKAPGALATTTDKTRVDTTFDPSVPHVMDSKAFYNPRAVQARADLKAEMGGNYSDELDHIIALELSGSNDKSNLQIEPFIKGTKNTATDPLENKLAKGVSSGKMSLFDAQVLLAKSKGTPTPFTGKTPDSGPFAQHFWGNINKYISTSVDDIKTVATKALQKGEELFSKPKVEFGDKKQGQIDPLEAKAAVDKANSFPNVPGERNGAESLDKSHNVAVNKGLLGRFYDAVKSTIAGVPGELAKGALSAFPKLPETFKEIETGLKTGNWKPYLAGLKDEANLYKTDENGKTVIGADGRPHIDTDKLTNLVIGFIGGDASEADSLKSQFEEQAAIKKTPRIEGGEKPTIKDATYTEVKSETPSYEETKAHITQSEGMDVDRAIKNGDIEKSEVYQGDGKTLNPKFAEGRIKDVAQKLENYQKGLGDAFRKEVQTVPATIKNIEKKGVDILESSTKGPTTQILEKLQGRDTVSKQFITDLTNSGEVKQIERDTIRNVLNSFGDKVKVPLFVEAVKNELLPLKINAPKDSLGRSAGGGRNVDDTAGLGYKYEHVTLPKELRGPVEDYKEHVFESPVKVTAGDRHFEQDQHPGYFGHTRIEDVPGNTRRIIEVQSDLYQKDNLQEEINKKARQSELLSKTSAVDLAQNRSNELGGLKRLQQYANPSAHFRMVREEIKQAALDGKTKLQFPTGETAMKIEGLGQGDTFHIINSDTGASFNDVKLTKENMSVGQDIQGNGQKWVITKVLGEGKFKAIASEKITGNGVRLLREGREQFDLPGTDSLNISNYAETFDISGKIDTSNPIYRFYEKDLGRYLKNNHAASLVTDKQGVTWYEVPVSKDAAHKPVKAFKKATRYNPLGRGPKIKIEDVSKLLKNIVPKDSVKLIFNPELIKEGALGQYDGREKMSLFNPKLQPIIELYSKGGKAYVRTAFHEAYHFLEDKVFSPEFKAALDKETLAKMTEKDHQYYKDLNAKAYNTPEKRASEYRADEFAKEESDKAGYKSPIKKILDYIRGALKKVVDTVKAIKEHFDAIPNKEGGFVKTGPQETNKSFPEGEEKSDLTKTEPSAREKLENSGSPFEESFGASYHNSVPEMHQIVNQAHVDRLGKLENKATALAIKKEALESHPAKPLEKYVNKKTGELPQALGTGRSKFGRVGDELASDLGYEDSESAREAYLEYKEQKRAYQDAIKKFKEEKQALMDAFKEDKANNEFDRLGHLNSDITEANFGVTPPVGRGGITPPEIVWRDFRDISMPRLGRDTMERNIEKVAPRPVADELKNFFTDPVHHNATEQVRASNSLRAHVRAKINQLGLKVSSVEAQLIMHVGEGNMSLTELKKATPKWKEVQEAADYFRRTYDNLLDEWNAVRAQYGYRPVPKRASYFRHFADIDWFTKNYGFINKEKDLPTSLAGETEWFKPGKPFTTAELHRTGKLTSFDAIRGMDNYINSVYRQMYHIDSIQRGKVLIKYLGEAAKASEAVGEPINLPNFKRNLVEYTYAQISGKMGTLDRALENTLGRPTVGFFEKLGRLAGKNIIAGNASAALSHLVSLPLNFATTDKLPLSKGLMTTLTSPFDKGGFHMIDGVESSFILRRYPDEAIQRTIPQKIEHVLNFLITTSDMFKVRLAVSSKYYEGISKGLSKEEAMKRADNYAGRIVGDYSIGGKPNLMNNRSVNLLAQFQLGMNDGLAVLAHDIPYQSSTYEQGKDGTYRQKRYYGKILMKFAQFAVFSYLLNHLLKNIRGAGKGIDPIDWGLQVLGFSQDVAGQSFPQRLATVGGDVLGELPFTSAVTGNFPLAQAIPSLGNVLSGKSSVKNEGIKTLSDFASPFGGGNQIRKTIQGLQAAQAKQGASAKDYVKGALFGQTTVNDKTTSNELHQLLANQSKSSKDQTVFAQQVYDTMKKLPADEARAEFDKLLQSNPALAKRVSTLATDSKLGITPTDKLIKQLGINSGARAKYIYTQAMRLPADQRRAYFASLAAKGLVDKKGVVVEQIQQLMSGSGVK